MFWSFLSWFLSQIIAMVLWYPRYPSHPFRAPLSPPPVMPLTTPSSTEGMVSSSRGYSYMDSMLASTRQTPCLLFQLLSLNLTLESRGPSKAHVNHLGCFLKKWDDMKMTFDAHTLIIFEQDDEQRLWYPDVFMLKVYVVVESHTKAVKSWLRHHIDLGIRLKSIFPNLSSLLYLHI